MAFDELEQHLRGLGIAPLTGKATPITPEVWGAIEDDAGGRFPDVVRWCFERSPGAEFPDSDVVYSDPLVGEVSAPLFLDGDELRDAYDYTREALPADVVPISDDGSGNSLCVGIGDENRGVVYFYFHDAPLDRNLHVVTDDFEHFVRSLHKLAGE